MSDVLEIDWISKTKEEALTRRAGYSWLHTKEGALENREELLSIIVDQSRHTIRGKLPPCGCCGRLISRMCRAYQCFQCGVWYCKGCAKIHFADTTTT